MSNLHSHPVDTLNANVMETAHVLQALRRLKRKCSAVIVTQTSATRMSNGNGAIKKLMLGGKDIYSASKGAAEIIFHGYLNSFILRVQLGWPRHERVT